MSFDGTATLETIEAALTALEGETGRRFQLVTFGYPPRKNLPGGFTAWLSMDTIRVAETTLTTAIEVHTVRVRIYRQMVAAASREDALLQYRVVPEVLDALKGDFALAGTIRAIDWGGHYGESVNVEFTDDEIGDVPYWVANITLPCIVDADSALFVA